MSDTPKELPGMLTLQEAVAKGEWPHTMDAMVWTKEFLARVKENPKIAHDEMAMVGWFANAIMAGYDHACVRNAVITSQRNELLEALDNLVQAEEDYGDDNNVAVNEAWLKGKLLVEKVKNARNT